MSAAAAPLPLPKELAENQHDRYLTSWKTADLPAPPPFNFRNALAIVGPGAIALSMSIGSGEWLAGPASAAQYGATILWITTLAVLGQVILNTEGCRYALYTGEPVYTGFLRTKPGPKFWGPFYTVLMLLNWGWPGWAATSATALAALFLSRMPTPADQGTVLIFAYIGFIAVVAALSFGGKVERALEYVSWFIVIWIFTFLIVIAVFFCSADSWGKMLGGFVSFGSIPQGADWFLLAGFAAYSGAGGFGNTTISNWARDKGYGMGAVVGFIPSAIGGKEIKMSHTGSVFKPTPENLTKWREWWKYLGVDQYILWAIGCFVGMGLCILLTIQYVPLGTKVAGFAVAAYQAEGLAKVGGQFLWVLTLLNGFWILWGTQLSISDGFVRTLTDMLWQGSSKVRSWRGGDVRAVYYTILIVFAVWGCIAMNLAQPLVLILLGANAAGFVMMITTIHVTYVNHKFLPRELRPPLWRDIVMVLYCLFCTFFVYQVAWYQLHTQLKWF